MSNSHNYLPHVRLIWLAFVLVFWGIQGASAENLDAVADKVIESDPRNKGAVSNSKCNSRVNEHLAVHPVFA
ncbi:MAG: hypothetical protein AWU57_2205 [Marinobacter sp. T13-3]|jgi:hypothetical protein|nr:MAG: hypothetical protein AWU57_2205 [Marinobacter sp. T13-3]